VKIKLALTLAALVSSTAVAGIQSDVLNKLRCQVSLEHSVKITPDYIQILDDTKPLYRMTGNSQLYIDGVQIHLSKQQQSLIEQYQALMQQLAPQISNLVSQGLALAKEAINTLLNDLSDDGKSLQRVEVISDPLQQRLAPLINQPAGEYLLSTDLIGTNPEEFSQMMAQELKQLASAATGQMLALLGQMIMTGQAQWGDAQQKLQQFSQQLARQGGVLGQQANKLCEKIEQLEALENELQQSIPEFSEYNLVKIKYI